jgi:hypothetical protein
VIGVILFYVYFIGYIIAILGGYAYGIYQLNEHSDDAHEYVIYGVMGFFVVPSLAFLWPVVLIAGPLYLNWKRLETKRAMTKENSYARRY